MNDVCYPVISQDVRQEDRHGNETQQRLQWYYIKSLTNIEDTKPQTRFFSECEKLFGGRTHTGLTQEEVFVKYTYIKITLAYSNFTLIHPVPSIVRRKVLNRNTMCLRDNLPFYLDNNPLTDTEIWHLSFTAVPPVHTSCTSHRSQSPQEESHLR